MDQYYKLSVIWYPVFQHDYFLKGIFILVLLKNCNLYD